MSHGGLGLEVVNSSASRDQTGNRKVSSRAGRWDSDLVTNAHVPQSKGCSASSR